MSTPKILRAVLHLPRQVSRMAQTLVKGVAGWLLRNWLFLNRRSVTSQAGFVLPTTILLLLVVTLTVGAIGYRTFTRSQQAIGERQQQVIYNAATPAIDRAKSKIEFLFDPDRERRSGGVPSQTQLLGIMLNDGQNLGNGIRVEPSNPGGIDPYTLPGEARIDINGDGVKDNAWRYPADLNGDGNATGPDDGTVAYSIIFTAPADPTTLRGPNVASRATARPFPQVRNAPLSNATKSTNACQIRSGAGSGPFVPINADGWFPDEVTTTKLRKNFQVNAYVLPNNPSGTVATLEFQQDREATQGFKWAAWFRNDLEIYPFPPFNWNGAMHTEGSLIVGDSNNFRGYMISSPASCLYTEEASQLTAADITADTVNDVPRFQGQFITGSLKTNEYAGAPAFDLFTGERLPPTENQAMIPRDDSITPTAGRLPADYALDPVQLQTRGVSVGRNVANPGDDKATTWDNSPLAERMVYARQDTPYVDDTFRADNRYGPYPRFGRQRTQIPSNIGSTITGNLELTGDDPQSSPDGTSLGLDGYWERRARLQGLRLIVGQRLELGDPAGWGGPRPDGGDVGYEPLKPWTECATNDSGRCNEARQRKTLWDNLSAVQATAVYHASSSASPDYPTACLATTVHPGTAGTLDKSATFENLAYGLPPTAFLPSVTGGRESYLTAGRSLITSDFLRGRGTNGWQFSVPPLTAFTDTSTGNPWMNAMKNLAQFAGDPNGGAPSFTPVQEGEEGSVHPYPKMAMWGDFSMLRRVIGLMESGVTYDSLSPADKTTLHTAGCLIGMLAYNVDYLEKLDTDAVFLADPNLIGYPSITDPADDNFAVGLRGRLRLLLRRNDSTLPATLAEQLPATLRGVGDNIPLPDPVLQAMVGQGRSDDPETFVRLLERWRDDASTPAAQRDEFDRQIYLAQLIISKEQVGRDRRTGFVDRLASTPLGQCAIWERQGTAEPLFSLCSYRPRFPILYSLFPAKYDPETTTFPETLTLAEKLELGYSGTFQSHRDVSPGSVESGVVRDNDDSADDYISARNAAVTYTVVRPESVATVPLGIPGTALGSAASQWTLPAEASGANGSTPNNNENVYIKICATPCSQPATPQAAFPDNRIPKAAPLYRVAFKDAAFYDGREHFSVRALDLDLGLMRTSPVRADFWLPQKGIVYAFREDAVSEAHIVRPYRNTWANCQTDVSLRTNATCQMNTGNRNAEGSIDPPVSDRKITSKPVDYYADPDRRPHGFRLRNGASLGRTGDDGRGLSFITHNPAYVMGYFNLHRAPGTTSLARNQGLEEFVAAQRLNTTTFDNFYTRTDLDLTFARPDSDQWRPSEVLADAVTPLSTHFCDGSIEDTVSSAGSTVLAANLARDRYGCSDGNITSYLNQARPSQAVAPVSIGADAKGVRWLRSTVADSYPLSLPNSATDNPAEGESPIVFRAGDYGNNPALYIDGNNIRPYEGSYFPLDGPKKPLVDAPNGIQMNMIMVSGLVPSRANQSYGGLHNFPRFIENWRDDELFISGAFLQLNFSTYATGPYDQDRWEVSQTPDGAIAENIPYYDPPLRRWGYDVGLQYAKAGPVAERFKFAEAIRSEFYSEPPSDDPYINSLRTCAQQPNNC